MMNVARNLRAVSRIYLGVPLSFLLFANSIPAQAQAPKPAPEAKALEVWVGHWKYEMDMKQSPAQSADKYSGELTVRWILKGFFQEWKYVDKRSTGTLESLELDWYDPASKGYPWHGYQSDGTVYSGTSTLSGKVWNWTSVVTKDGVEYKTRGVAEVAADGMSYTEKSEISADGKTWMPNFERKATKVKASN